MPSDNICKLYCKSNKEIEINLVEHLQQLLGVEAFLLSHSISLDFESDHFIQKTFTSSHTWGDLFTPGTTNHDVFVYPFSEQLNVTNVIASPDVITPEEEIKELTFTVRKVDIFSEKEHYFCPGKYVIEVYDNDGVIVYKSLEISIGQGVEVLTISMDETFPEKLSSYVVKFLCQTSFTHVSVDNFIVKTIGINSIDPCKNEKPGIYNKFLKMVNGVYPSGYYHVTLTFQNGNSFEFPESYFQGGTNTLNLGNIYLDSVGIYYPSGFYRKKLSHKKASLVFKNKVVVCCFLKDSEILIYDKANETSYYQKIQNLKIGDSVCTFSDDLSMRPIKYIYKCTMLNDPSAQDPINKLYIIRSHLCTKDLVVTGGHAFHVDQLTTQQYVKTI